MYQSLLDKLLIASEHVPASHLVDNTRTGKVLSALALYSEFGDEFLDAALEAEDTRRAQENPNFQGVRGPDYGVPRIIAAPYSDDLEVNDGGIATVSVAPPPEFSQREADLERRERELAAREAAAQSDQVLAQTESEKSEGQ